mgnify:CR=1 FL=1
MRQFAALGVAIAAVFVAYSNLSDSPDDDVIARVLYQIAVSVNTSAHAAT